MATTTKKQQPAKKKATSKKPAVKARKPTQTIKTAAKKAKQALFLQAYVEGGFNIAEACRKSGISRPGFQHWAANDPAFVQQMNDAWEAKMDAWEHQLHKNILAGDTTSVIFALKTKAKERGYVERENNSRQSAKIIERIQSGELSEVNAGYEFAKLGLPLPEILKLRVGKSQIEAAIENDFTPVSEEELERRASERLAAIQQQREQFLPERRAEVAEIKERLKDQDSFAPDKFEGE